MSSNADWRELALTTVTDPAHAARRLIALDFRRDVLWLALLVASLVNTILLFGPSLLLEQPILLPGFLALPLPYFIAVAGGLIIMIGAVFWIGRLMGGKGRPHDVAVVLIWLQLIRDVVQVAVLVLQFIFPLAAILLAAATAFYSIYVVLHFVDQAHQFGSLGRSAGVLALSLLAVVMALTLLLAMIGGGSFGDASAYV